MRSSHATWILIAISAAAMCLETGCVGSRLGKGMSGMRMSSRPRLLGRWRSGGETEIADTTPTPPSSTIPPAGLATSDGPGSRNFPSQGAPGSDYDMPNYQSTDRSAGDMRMASGGRNFESSGMSRPQQGFYNNDYAGGAGGSTSRFSDGPGSGGSGGSFDSRGYDRGNLGGSPGYSPSGGARSDFGPSYSADAGRRPMSDARGSDGYGYDPRSSGDVLARGTTDGTPRHMQSSTGGASRYDMPPDSRYVSPQGGGSFDGHNNPAASSGSFDRTSPSAGDDYGRFSSGPPTTGGSRFDDAPPASGGGSRGGFDSAPRGGAQPAGFFPGSTKPYNPQPLSPPTGGNYGGGSGSRW